MMARFAIRLLSILFLLPAIPPAQAAAADPDLTAPAKVTRFPPSRQERTLVSGLLDVRKGHLDAALIRLGQLTEQQPDFKLAQLVYGDLLMARTGRLRSFGNGGPPQLLEGLQHEAKMRLLRYLESPPPSALPTQLLKIPDDVGAAMLFDVSSNRVFVLGNRGGRIERLDDFYISIGKGGTDKRFEGDEKTPVGVYHVSSYLPGERLPDLYGAGAFPINYPNEWDKAKGRTGSGIWIHGTDFSTYSRAPLSSLGCLTLSNEDFKEVRNDVQVGRTPVVVAAGLDWADAATAERDRKMILLALEAWKTDWESLDTDRYLSHYSSRFQPEQGTRASFAAHKRRVNANKKFINVDLRQVGIYRYPGEKELILVEFLQDYRSSNLNARRRKHQYWRREAGGWKIVIEGGA